MHFTLKSAIFVIILASYCIYAHDKKLPRKVKSENGLIISWDHSSSDAKSNQVDLSDEQGHSIAGLNLLMPVPDARRVSIYDVSARANIIAVAAVYVSKQQNQVRPTATLVLFDFSGHLLSAFALEPSHQIDRLAVDDESNIWTITRHADRNVDPSTVPMVVEYTAQGKVARELLMRNLFPFHATDTRRDVEIGAPTMGYDRGTVWFWLPGSTDFVTVSTSDGQITRTKTQLPQRAGRDAVPVQIVREPSGNLVAQVGEYDEQGKRVPAHYMWSPTRKAWARFNPSGCVGDFLIGSGDKGLVYRPGQVGRTDACVTRTPD